MKNKAEIDRKSRKWYSKVVPQPERVKEIFMNRVGVKAVEQISCEYCYEYMLFHLQDGSVIGLTTAVECLMIAIKAGVLPKLPSAWVVRTDFMCHSNYFDDKATNYPNDEIPSRGE